MDVTLWVTEKKKKMNCWDFIVYLTKGEGKNEASSLTVGRTKAECVWEQDAEEVEE